MSKTKRARWSSKAVQPQTLPRGTEQIDTNGETIQHRSTTVNYGELELKVLAMEAAEPGISDKLVQAWINFKPKVPFKYVVASLRARRQK